MFGLLHIFFLSALYLSAQAYFWDEVVSSTDYHQDTVYHQSQYEGTVLNPLILSK